MSYSDQVQRLVLKQGSIAENDLLRLPIVHYGQHQTQNPGFAPEQTYYVVLDWKVEAFHKPFKFVNVSLAGQFGHHRREPPLNDCSAWRLAHAIGGVLEEIVAPTVMRFHPPVGWGGLSKKWHGQAGSLDFLSQRPDQSRAAAFLDSLIAQQDRHFGNTRWDSANQHLGLFDHGYAFALPGDPINYSDFVQWRWDQGEEALETWEKDALDELLHSHDLHGLADFLRADRAYALDDRARRMLASGSILPFWDF